MGKKKKQQNPEVVSDGRDIEFSEELADKEDLEALARSKAADARAKNRKL